MNKLVVLLIGASSGIGYETARMLAKKGHKVYGAARRTERMNRFVSMVQYMSPLTLLPMILQKKQ